MKPLLPIELLKKYNAGTASEDERELVEQWYASFEKDSDPLQRMSESELDQLEDTLFKRIQQQTISPPRTSIFKKWLRPISIAAGVLIVLTSVLLYWQKELFHSASMPLAYTNALKMPQRITLTDGSQVWLYPGAALKLQDDFGKTTRSLQLEGVAFFKVKRDESLPFIIYTKGLVTQVLGTSFLIDATPEKRRVEVSVLTGKVRVQEEHSREYIVLLPKQKILYQKGQETQVYQTSKQDGSNAWTQESFDFENTPMQEVVDRLSKSFGIRFEAENEAIFQCQVTAHFAQQNLPDMLEMLSKSLGIEYEFNRTQVILKGKGCP